MVKAMGFPGRYEQGPGALKQLGRILTDMGRSRPLVVCDEFVARHLWPEVGDALQMHGFEPLHIEFPGECTHAAIAQLSEQALIHSPDTIIALGGGRRLIRPRDWLSISTSPSLFARPLHRVTRPPVG